MTRKTDFPMAYKGSNSAVLGGQEYNLKNRIRHLRRVRWAARRIDATTALTAYMAFTADQDDDDLELTIGRLLVLLDQHESSARCGDA
jgi:hypothetical protein